MFSRKNLFLSLKHYISNIIFVWLAFLIYTTNRYYTTFLNPRTLDFLFLLSLGYTIIGFPYHVVSTYKGRKSKGIVVLGVIFKVIKNLAHKLNLFIEGKPLDITPEEKKNILFMLVKFFYLPIMFQFVINNYYAVAGDLPRLKTIILTKQTFNSFVYPFALSTIFFLDTLVFSFGYSIESKKLKSKVRSVEPTLFGWVVAIICYPPFNNIMSWYLPWGANEHVYFGSINTTFYMRLLFLALFGIYLWATFALGPKSSNLTNRGTVSWGPYKYVRHPAYISKNLVWWLSAIPAMSFSVFISLCMWSFIYFLRAITEERHLMQDREYQEYVKKVKYRFVPKLF